MDQSPSSPPASTSSGTPTASASTSTQPTYTTAGTLYNPSSSQPLQPPARRGRSCKWASSGPHSDLGLFPKVALTGMTPKPGSTGRASTTPSFQNYTPLQQNYDRAVSPISDPDHELLRMSLEAPRLRPIDNLGSVPAFPPLDPVRPFPSLDIEKPREENTSDDDDYDSDFGMDPLLNMTVKSLHNLASYPNPNQKRAQKALLRGVKTNLSGLAASSRLSTSPSYPTFGSLEASRDVDDNPQSFVRSTLSDPAVLRRNLAEGRPNRFELGRATTYHSMDSRLSSPAPNSDYADFGSSSSTTLASGPGAPRPLTAGPPGQRQYRPSTFESTFKALQTQLQTQSQPQSHAFEDAEVISYTQQTLVRAGIDGYTLDSGSYPAPFRLSPHIYPDTSKASARPIGYERGTMSSSGTHRDDYFMATESSAYVPSSRDMAAQSSCGWQSEYSRSEWRHFSSAPDSRFRPRTDRLTDEELEARNRRINRQWYAGTGIFEAIWDDVIEDKLQKSKKNVYGAVGDGRPAKKDHSDSAKDQPGAASVEGAQRIPASGHTDAIINMTFTSILQNAENRSSQRHSPSGSPMLRPCDREHDQLSFFGNTFQRTN